MMETTDEFSALPLSELRDKCREQGLPVSGTKSELAARLAAAGSGRDVAAEGGVLPPAPLDDAPNDAPVDEPSGPREQEAPPFPSGPLPDVPHAAEGDDGVELSAPRVSGEWRWWEVELTAVKPSAVDERWLRKCEQKVLRRAMDAGETPCGEVEQMGSDNGGKTWRWRVPVRA